jgi:hypothetical protein
MMRRCVATLTLLLSVAACSSTESTAPQRSAATGASFSELHDGLMVPGSGGNASTAADRPLACMVPAALTDSALIGPSGGELDVGPHRLIIPPGALTTTMWLSGTVPAGNSLRIDFQPEGLQFKKPAGLILDASSCADVPNIVYLNEDGGIEEHIQAIFSNWWHTIAAPIDHFSGYMLEV